MVTIHQHGALYFNADAGRRWFDDVDEVSFYGIPEEGRLGISLGAGGGVTYTVTHSASKAGVKIAAGSVLNWLDVDVDSLDASVRVPVEWAPDEGLLVVDLSELQGGSS
jgi:hypothetical protein